jgi:uncharacterized UPF0160 family protein
MTQQTSKPVLATHSGKFHCDEVFGYAVLRLALGLTTAGEDHVLLRTRNAADWASADIVWDVGGVFDAPNNRFDHHQRGAPLREDGTPYSSAGLVWQVYGARAVGACLPDPAFAETIAADIESALVRRIDEIDNGIGATPAALDLSRLIEDHNPTWDSPAATGPGAGDIAFQDAAALATSVLRRRIEILRARYAAQSEILAAHEAAADPRILILTRGMPWKNVVFAENLPTLFTISPASNGNWMLDTVPPEPGSFDQRKPLPANWAGLSDAALALETGVPDAVFCHLRRFVAAARSRDGALALAQLALASK